MRVDVKSFISIGASNPVRSSPASKGTESSRWIREARRGRKGEREKEGRGKEEGFGERRERETSKENACARVEDTTSPAANCNFVVRSL